MVNLPDLAERLQKSGLLQKSFLDCTKSEILQVVEAVFSSIGEDVPPEGWSQPRIEDGVLIIPHDVHPKYHWWSQDGQSIMDTLLELEAPFEVAKKYLCSRLITEDAYLNKLIPF